MMMCGPGQEMDPTKGCGCMSAEELRKKYYPSWANEYDISVAIQDGYKQYFD